MAFDTVIDKIQFEAGLTATANAIRKKTGDSALIEWTTDKGFANAVDAIKNSDISTLQGIVFYDCYGEAIDTYPVDQIDTLTALPDLPEVDGLICEGWNYSLDEVKAHGRDLCVGANYITNDEKTRIYITLTADYNCPMLGVAVDGIVTVDWGDGSLSDILIGEDLSLIQWTPNHQYTSAGEYIITLTVDGAMAICGDDFLIGSCLLRNSRNIDITNQNYQNSIQKIELGNNVVSLNDYALSNCGNLINISIPNCVSNIGAYAFRGCASLKSITIPKGVLHINDSTFEGCYSLTSVSIPNSVTTIGEFAFSDCYSLAFITVPDSVIGIGEDAFNNCARLVGVLLPNGELILGTVDFEVHCYDSIGELITTIYPEGNIPEGAFNSNAPLFSSNNMQAGDTSTVYIAVKNTGTLDMEYKIVFYVNGHQPEDNAYLGACWYKFTEITTELNEVMLEDYAVSNPSIPCNSANCIESHTCTEKDAGTKSMVSLPGYYFGKASQKIGTTCYYRLDYGMYRDATLDEYSDRQFSVSAGIYAARDGDLNDLDGGMEITRMVTDSETLQIAIDQALHGDTILLMEDITYTGDLIIKKCLNFEAGGKTLTVNGNMIYDFISSSSLTIDLRKTGAIKVLAYNEAGGNFIISAPKSQVKLIGGGKGDLFIDGHFAIDATNAVESDGCLFSNMVIMNGEGSNSKTVDVRSNTRITVDSLTTLECIEAAVQSINIEIRNKGQINQILLEDMYATSQTNAPQIYICNYNKIGNIILPIWSVPFIKENDGGYSGNTRVTVLFDGVIDTLTGSAAFDDSHIEDEGADLYVEQIVEGLDTGLRVYYRDLPNETGTSLEAILADYFEGKNITGDALTSAYSAIETLEIICRGDKLVQATDIAFVKGSLNGIVTLDMSQSTIDGNSLANNALSNISTLANVNLPKSLVTLGANAFSGTSIKGITIPATVTSIGDNALLGIKFVYMQSYEPCTISSKGHNTSTFFFVPDSAVDTYRSASVWSGFKDRIYPMAQLADDGLTHVRKLNDGTYEIVNYAGDATEIEIGNGVTLDGTTLAITSVGENAYRNLTHTFTLKFHSGVNNVSQYAFYATKVTGMVNFGTVKTIGTSAFENCYYLTVIDEGNSIETIEPRGFYSCSRLYQVSLPRIVDVGDRAFTNGYSLVSISFGEALKSLGKNMFDNATNLREITIKAPVSSEVTFAENPFDRLGATALKNLRFYVAASDYSGYCKTLGKNINIQNVIYNCTSMICEDGEKFGTNTVGVYYQNVFLGDVELGMFRVRDMGNNSVSISSCTLQSSDVSDENFWSSFNAIPDTFNGKTVVRIGPSAYRVFPFSKLAAPADAVLNPWGNNNTTIPGTVTEIGNYAFYRSDISITSLRSVESVGDYAFAETTKLYYIDAPALASAGIYAFDKSTGLRQLSANALTSVGNYCFSNCTQLMRLFVRTLPGGATSWLQNSTKLVELWLATDLTKAPTSNLLSYSSHPSAIIISCGSSSTRKMYDYDTVVPANVSDYTILDENSNVLCVLEDMAEYWVTEYTGDSRTNTVTILNCFNKTPIIGTFSIPASLDTVSGESTVRVEVASIGFSAFGGVSFNSNGIILPPTVVNLGNRAFNTSTLSGTLNLNNVTSIGQYAFSSSGITSVVGNSLLTMDQYSFAYCSSLKSVSLPRLTVVPQYSLSDCPSLQSVYLEDVTKFDANCFTNSNVLSNITINRDITSASGLPSWTTTNYATSAYSIQFYVPTNSMSWYELNENYVKFPIHALDEVLINDDGTYYLVNCGDGWELMSFTPVGNPTSIIIPQTHGGKDIITISADAFKQCTSVVDITIPASVSYYQQGVFSGMTALQNVYVASGSAYYKSVDGVLFTKNGKELVYYPGRKTAMSYNVPSGVEIIQSHALEGATILENIVVSADVTVIGYEAFNGVGIKSITFEGTVPPYLVDTNVFNVNTDGFTIYVPTGSGDTYKNCNSFIKYEEYIVEY